MASLPDGAQNEAYEATLTATGGTGSYTWALASGSLPAGLTLPASGEITDRELGGPQFCASRLSSSKKFWTGKYPFGLRCLVLG